MKTLTVRQVPDDVHEALRLRAAAAGRSMEEEVRVLLARAAGPRRSPDKVLADLHQLARRAHGGEMPSGVVDEFLAERRAEARKDAGQ